MRQALDSLGHCPRGLWELCCLNRGTPTHPSKPSLHMPSLLKPDRKISAKSETDNSCVNQGLWLSGCISVLSGQGLGLGPSTWHSIQHRGGSVHDCPMDLMCAQEAKRQPTLGQFSSLYRLRQGNFPGPPAVRASVSILPTSFSIDEETEA